MGGWMDEWMDGWVDRQTGQEHISDALKYMAMSRLTYSFEETI